MGNISSPAATMVPPCCGMWIITQPWIISVPSCCAILPMMNEGNTALQIMNPLARQSKSYVFRQNHFFTFTEKICPVGELLYHEISKAELKSITRSDRKSV